MLCIEGKTIIIIDQKGVIRDIHVGYSPNIGEKLFRSTRAYVREHFTDDFIPLIEFDERKLVGAPAHVKLMVDDGMKMLDEAAERIKADAGENVLEEAKLFLRSAVGGSASDAYAAYMRAH